MHTRVRQLGDFMDVLQQGADVAEHVLAGGQGLDLSDFAVIAGSRFEVGSRALSETCDRVCSRLGRLLAAVGGAVRVIRAGFAGSIRGGAATFDRLDAACDAYGKAKKRRSDVNTVFLRSTGQTKEHWREQLVEAEVNVALAQKRIIEALGGSLITASTQANAAQANGAKPPAPAANNGGALPTPAPRRPRHPVLQKKKAGTNTLLLAALAAGTVFAITRG